MSNQHNADVNVKFYQRQSPLLNAKLPPSRNNFVLIGLLVTGSALAIGLATATILFPVGSDQAHAARAQKPTKPANLTVQKRIKLASSGALTVIPNSASATPAETVVPRQKDSTLNPYIKVRRHVPPVAPNQPQLNALTDAVVGTLERLKHHEQTNQPEKLQATTVDLRRAISALVNQATGQGKSGDYVQSLIDDALAGRDAIPLALANSNGKLDTRLLLASVLPKTNVEKVGKFAPDYLAALKHESEHLADPKGHAKPKTVAKKNKPKQRIIIVRAGDNLSKIAMRAYGDPLAYPRIFRANQKTLTSANLLDVGQRLLIPR